MKKQRKHYTPEEKVPTILNQTENRNDGTNRSRASASGRERRCCWPLPEVLFRAESLADAFGTSVREAHLTNGRFPSTRRIRRIALPFSDSRDNVAEPVFEFPKELASASF
jgi:hypothetical protein